MIKELETEFEGKGEVKGFFFRQITSNGYAYVYRVKHPDVKEPYYEVFERRINEQYDCVSYPKSKSFGLWAWCCINMQKAMERYAEITERMKNRENENKKY